MKKRAVQGAVKVFCLVRVVIVALVCLLIGFSARQLFDAYGPEMIPFVKKEILHRQQVHMITTPQQDVSIRLDPAEPRWD